MQNFNLSPEEIDRLCSKAEEVINRIAKRLEEKEKAEEEARKEAEEKAKAKVALEEEASPPSIEMEVSEEVSGEESAEAEEDKFEMLIGEEAKEIAEGLRGMDIPCEVKGGKLSISCPLCGKEDYLQISHSQEGESVLKWKCSHCGWETGQIRKEVSIPLMPLSWHAGRYNHLEAPYLELERFFGVDDDEKIYIPPILLLLEDYFKHRVETDPALWQIDALFVLGALHAPFIRFDPLFGEDEGRWDLGLMVVAPSGVYHKSSQQKIARSLLTNLQNHLPYLEVSSKQQPSPEGLVDAICTEMEKREGLITSFFWTISEASNFFSGRKDDYKWGNIAFFLNLLDGESFERDIRRQRITLDASNARFTVMLATTFEALNNSIDLDLELKTGFLGRWLLYIPPDKNPRDATMENATRLLLRKSSTQIDPKEKKDEFNTVFKMLLSRGEWFLRNEIPVLRLTPEAEELYDWWRIFTRILATERKEMTSWMARLPYNTLKIASLIALEDAYEQQNPNPTIEAYHMTYPIRLALRFWIPSYFKLLKQMGESVLETKNNFENKLYRRIQEYLKKNREVKRTDFLRRFSPYKCDAGLLDKYLHTMQEAGEIRITITPRGGKIIQYIGSE